MKLLLYVITNLFVFRQAKIGLGGGEGGVQSTSLKNLTWFRTYHKSMVFHPNGGNVCDVEELTALDTSCRKMNI